MVQRDPEALKQAARAAWKFVLPLVEMTSPKIRRFVDDQAAINRLSHKRDLVDHRSRSAPAPNNDTLYSAAHLDLAAGPVTLTLPETGDRYYSVALLDAWTDHIAIPGTRTLGGGGSIRLVGPGAGDPDESAIVSPTRYVWCLIRTLVDGPDDLAAAHRVQDAFTLLAPPAPEMTSEVDYTSPWDAYFTRASQLLRDNPPRPQDEGILTAIAPLELDGFDPAGFTAAEVSAIKDGIALARQDLARVRASTIVQGWSYPAAHIGNFGTDYDFRALVAMTGIGALPPQEAMYMRAMGDLKGASFDGSKPWRLHLPPGQWVPVDGFWSLSLYELTPDRQLFFTDNPINRYAIGDRTPGIVPNADGSLDIWIGHARPEGNRASNWLPAPSGPFALILRAYLPRESLQTGEYRLPQVEEA